MLITAGQSAEQEGEIKPAVKEEVRLAECEDFRLS